MFLKLDFTVCLSQYLSNYFIIFITIRQTVLSNFSIIFELVISEAKFHIAISFCICILINLGGHFLTGALSINMKYGW